MASSNTALIAIHRDAQSAAAAADDVRRGAPELSVRVGDAHDRVSSLEAEMHEEIEHTYLAPQAGFVFTKEMVKSMLVLVPAGAAIGMLVTLPLALFAFDSGSTAMRVTMALIIGAVAGGTIGTIVGAGLGARGPADQAAAHVGVPVRVDGPFGEEVVRKLIDHRPIRLDLVQEDGTPVRTLMTEEDTDPGGIFQRLRHQFTQDHGGDWSSVQSEELDRIQAVNREMEEVANRPEDD
jgi:hypothetical protein